MTDEPRNLILEHLRALRLDMTELKASNRDIRSRLVTIENYLAALHGDTARSSSMIDELQRRIERIETRVGLVD